MTVARSALSSPASPRLALAPVPVAALSRPVLALIAAISLGFWGGLAHVAALL